MLTGRCHCGAVQFRIPAQNSPQDLMRCNCSLCRRKGAIMGTARREEFELTQGAEKLCLYEWNTGVAKHYFCSICGIYTHHQRRRRPDEIGYNVGCLDGIDLDALGKVSLADGQSLSVVD